MKAVPVFLIIILGISINVSAQSGRRVQSPPSAPSSVPQVQQTQDVTSAKQEETVGYSESAPNAPRSLSPNSGRDKKSKKASKKETPAPPASQTTDAAKSSPSSADDEEVVKVETNFVSIPVSVYDRNGLYIPNLSKENFKIFENGVEQEIAYFGTSDKPFSVVLLIDVSPSTEYKIEEIQEAAAAFVGQLKSQDNVMVVEFDSSVHVLTEMTGDRDKIYKAIRKTGFGDATSLYDAVDFSLRKRLDKIEGRKAIVLFTDGVDTSSGRANFESTVRDAEESDSLIFPIYYNTFLANRGIGQGGAMSVPPTLGLPRSVGGQPTGTSSAEYARGRAYLNELAAATGGRVFRPDSTPGGLTAAFEGIAEELRRQYNIGYYPVEVGEAGERKQIRVRVNRPKLVIRARDSYIVGSTADNSSAASTAPQKFNLVSGNAKLK